MDEFAREIGGALEQTIDAHCSITQKEIPSDEL